jgi:hypothetical protein
VRSTHAFWLLVLCVLLWLTHGIHIDSEHPWDMTAVEVIVRIVLCGYALVFGFILHSYKDSQGLNRAIGVLQLCVSLYAAWYGIDAIEKKAQLWQIIAWLAGAAYAARGGFDAINTPPKSPPEPSGDQDAPSST